jgi:hypothetical protein
VVKPTSRHRHTLAIPAVVASLALAAAPLAGCGEGGQATGRTASAIAAATATVRTATTTAPTAASHAKAATVRSSGKGDDARGEAIIKYGKPGPPGEKDVVAATVESYYAALVADRVPVLCTVLSGRLIDLLRGEIEHETAIAHLGGCADVIKHVIRPPSPTRPKLPPTTVTEIRLYRDQGFAIIRNDANGHLKEMTIEREHGAWKIGSLIATRVR